MRMPVAPSGMTPPSAFLRAQGRGCERGRATARQVLRELSSCLEWHDLRLPDAAQRACACRLALVALTLGVALRLSAMEFAVIILAIVAVIAAEMINTVAEAIVDLVTDTYHPLAKIAKDVAAGAVLWSAIGAVAVGSSSSVRICSPC